MADPLADIFATNSQSDPLADLFAKPQGPSMPVGIARSAAQGLTFGFGDEIEAGLRTGFGYGGDYDKTVKEIRDSNKAFGKEHPVLSTVTEVAGALPTAWVPGMGQAGLATAVARGGAGQIAKHSANVGLRTGLAHGAGSGEGDLRTGEGLLNRGASALTHGGAGMAAGYVAGPVINSIAKGVSAIARTGSEALREGSNPTSNAMRRALTAAGEDGATPDAMRAAILPSYGRGATVMPADKMETILSNYGTSLGNNLSEREARQTAVAAILRANADEIAAARAAGQPVPAALNPTTAENQVREVVRRYNEMHQIPMMLHELPGVVNGVGDAAASNMAMRTAANRANPAMSGFQRQVVERQKGITEDLEGVVSTALGGRDGREAYRAADAALKRANNQNYGLAEAADNQARQAIGLPPTTARPSLLGNQPPPALPTPTPAQMQGVQPIDITGPLVNLADHYRLNAGPVAKGMDDAINLFFEPNTQTGIRSLRQFIQQKQALDDMIEASMTKSTIPGVADRPTQLTRELVRFKEELMQLVGQQNPLYARANAAAAEGFTDLRMAAVAKDLTLQSGPKQRRAMIDFESASPEAQELMRLMHAELIADKIVNAPRTGNPGKFFNTKAARDAIIAIHGPENGGALLAQADRTALASQTHHHLKGQSQTGPLQQAWKDGDIAGMISAMYSHLNPLGALKGIGEYAGRKWNASRDAELLRLYSASTERPDLMLEALRRMAAAQQQQALTPPLQQLPQQIAPFAAIVPGRAMMPDH